MGLDCYIVNGVGGGRIGSYSGVHTLRGILLEAAIKYLMAAIKQNYSSIIHIFLDNMLTESESENAFLVLHNDLILDKISNFVSTDLSYTDIVNLSNIKEDILSHNPSDIDENVMLFTPLDAFQILLTWQHRSIGIGNSIDYGEVSVFDMTMEGNSLSIMDLSGLHKFICHSDCDGIYTPGDCFDIVSTINTIRPFIEDKNNILQWVDDITKYFQESYDQNKPLQYC